MWVGSCRKKGEGLKLLLPPLVAAHVTPYPTYPWTHTAILAVPEPPGIIFTEGERGCKVGEEHGQTLPALSLVASLDANWHIKNIVTARESTPSTVPQQWHEMYFCLLPPVLSISLMAWINEAREKMLHPNYSCNPWMNLVRLSGPRAIKKLYDYKAELTQESHAGILEQ